MGLLPRSSRWCPPTEGDHETGAEVVGVATAEVAHTRDHGELLIAVGSPVVDAASQHDAIPSTEPSVGRDWPWQDPLSPRSSPYWGNGRSRAQRINPRRGKG